MDDVTLSELLDPANDTAADETALVSTDDTQAFSELAEEMVSLTGAMFGLLLPGHAADVAEDAVTEAESLEALEEPQLTAAPEPIEIPQLGVAVPDREERAVDLPQLIVDMESAELTEFTEYPQFPETVELAAPETASEPTPAVATPKSMALLQEIAFLDD